MSDDFDAAKRVELCHHGRKIACPECVDEDPAVEYMLRGEVIGLRAKVREQAEEIERLKRRLAVLDEWEQGHEEAHQRAVDDCPHEEKTWTCCATCHCVEIERRRKAEAEASEHESRANRWMVQAQHAEAELAAERESHAKTAKQFVDEHSLAGSLEIQLAAERERAEKLGKALRGLIGYQGTWSVEPDTPYGRAVAAAREALRPAAPEAKESDCTCGEQWPCPLHGGPPAAPEPTPSEDEQRLARIGTDVFAQRKATEKLVAAGSEQPDLPLGHEFVPCDPRVVGRHGHPADYCHADEPDVPQGCGQPESAHRRK